MYKIYDTKGFIIDKKDSGSDDLSYLIFTEKFGFINAKAYSVRLEKSKMTSFLQIYNFCNISITKGKGGWTITGGSLIKSIYYEFGQEYLILYKKVINLILRLSIKEERQKDMFDILEESLAFAENNKGKDLAEIELFLYLKSLNNAGYLDVQGINSKVGDIFSKNNFKKETIEKIRENKEFLTEKINLSLREIVL